MTPLCIACKRGITDHSPGCRVLRQEAEKRERELLEALLRAQGEAQ